MLIANKMLRKAEQLIESCDHCNPESAEIPFDNILDLVTGLDPSVTDYILDGECPIETLSKRHWWNLRE